LSTTGRALLHIKQQHCHLFVSVRSEPA
jgi:hypothetical protein